MTHEKPCCGAACSCDSEDTWNEPEECTEADDACDNCQGSDAGEACPVHGLMPEACGPDCKGAS